MTHQCQYQSQTNCTTVYGNKSLKFHHKSATCQHTPQKDCSDIVTHHNMPMLWVKANMWYSRFQVTQCYRILFSSCIESSSRKRWSSCLGPHSTFGKITGMGNIWPFLWQGCEYVCVTVFWGRVQTGVAGSPVFCQSFQILKMFVLYRQILIGVKHNT